MESFSTLAVASSVSLALTCLNLAGLQFDDLVQADERAILRAVSRDAEVAELSSPVVIRSYLIAVFLLTFAVLVSMGGALLDNHRAGVGGGAEPATVVFVRRAVAFLAFSSFTCGVTLSVLAATALLRTEAPRWCVPASAVADTFTLDLGQKGGKHGRGVDVKTSAKNFDPALLRGFPVPLEYVFDDARHELLPLTGAEQRQHQSGSSSAESSNNGDEGFDEHEGSVEGGSGRGEFDRHPFYDAQGRSCYAVNDSLVEFWREAVLRYALPAALFLAALCWLAAYSNSSRHSGGRGGGGGGRASSNKTNSARMAAAAAAAAAAQQTPGGDVVTTVDVPLLKYLKAAKITKAGRRAILDSITFDDSEDSDDTADNDGDSGDSDTDTATTATTTTTPRQRRGGSGRVVPNPTVEDFLRRYEAKKSPPGELSASDADKFAVCLSTAKKLKALMVQEKQQARTEAELREKQKRLNATHHIHQQPQLQPQSQLAPWQQQQQQQQQVERPPGEKTVSSPPPPLPSSVQVQGLEKDLVELVVSNAEFLSDQVLYTAFGDAGVQHPGERLRMIAKLREKNQASSSSSRAAAAAAAAAWNNNTEEEGDGRTSSTLPPPTPVQQQQKQQKPRFQQPPSYPPPPTHPPLRQDQEQAAGEWSPPPAAAPVTPPTRDPPTSPQITSGSVLSFGSPALSPIAPYLPPPPPLTPASGVSDTPSAAAAAAAAALVLSANHPPQLYPVSVPLGGTKVCKIIWTTPSSLPWGNRREGDCSGGGGSGGGDGNGERYFKIKSTSPDILSVKREDVKIKQGKADTAPTTGTVVAAAVAAAGKSSVSIKFTVASPPGVPVGGTAVAVAHIHEVAPAAVGAYSSPPFLVLVDVFEIQVLVGAPKPAN